MQVCHNPKYLVLYEIFNAHCIHGACVGVRAWVLSDRSWALTTFVAVLSLAPLGLAYVSYSENLPPITA